MRIGLLGCGNVGQLLARQDRGRRIVAVYDREPDRCHLVAEITDAQICDEPQAFLSSDFDVMVEAASVEAVQEYCEPALKREKDVVVLSVGAFADESLRTQVEALAKERGRKIHIPSGAVFGLDNLKISQVSRLDHVLLRSTKKPASLNLDTDKKELLFRGSAYEGIRRFPRNVNIAVALSLAAGREIDMELWVDPTATRTRHEILIEGEFGRASIVIDNVPCPENPATSHLAALSVMTLLERLDEPLIIGT